MKKLLTLALLLCGIAAGAQDLEGTFTQAKTLKISGRVIKSEGTISFSAPDQLAMLYTKPDGDYFIIDGPYLRMDMRGVTLDVNTENNKTVQSQRNAILYSIAGRYEDIAKEMDADCTVSTGKDGGKHVVIKVRKTFPKGYSYGPGGVRRHQHRVYSHCKLVLKNRKICLSLYDYKER